MLIYVLLKYLLNVQNGIPYIRFKTQLVVLFYVQMHDLFSNTEEMRQQKNVITSSSHQSCNSTGIRVKMFEKFFEEM